MLYIVHIEIKWFDLFNRIFSRQMKQTQKQKQQNMNDRNMMKMSMAIE